MTDDGAVLIEAVLEKRASLMTEMLHRLDIVAQTNPEMAAELARFIRRIGILDSELKAKILGTGVSPVNGSEQSQSVPASAPMPDPYGIPERVYSRARNESTKRGGKARALAMLMVAMKPEGAVDVRQQIVPMALRAGINFGEQKVFFKNTTNTLADKRWFRYDKKQGVVTLTKQAYEDFA